MTAINPFLSRLRANFEEGGDGTFCTLVGDFGTDTLTWRGFEQSCLQFTSAYRSVGLSRGDLIFIFLRHGRSLYGSFFGAMLDGFVPSFMPCLSPRQNPDIYWSSHTALLEGVRPAAIVASEETFEQMRAAGLNLDAHHLLRVNEVESAAVSDRAFMSENWQPDNSSVALLQHSSGTTGLKKGVALTYDAIVKQIESYGLALGLTSQDRIASWLPLYHDMGLIACCVLPAYFGISIVHIDPFYWLSKPWSLFDAIVSDRSTFAWLPNFAYEHMVVTCGRSVGEYDLAHMRAFINCSEPCKAETFDRFATAFEKYGVRPEQLQCCYAMAESVFAVSQTALGEVACRVTVDASSLQPGGVPRNVTIDDCNAIVLLASGLPINGVSVGVFNEFRRPLAAGHIGEIGLSGEFLFSGYNQAATLTAERLVDGIYYTRDLGFVAGGNVFVLGRLDDLIIINGRNLYAHDVEVVVGSIEGVKPGRCVAYAQFDPRVGSETLIIISEQQHESLRSKTEILRDIMAGVLSTFSVTPRKVHIFQEGWLIKTTSGKINRKANQEKLENSIRERTVT